MDDEAFDKQARWAEIQIKATEVLGRYAKDIAEARKTDAQALAEEIRDKALDDLQKQLDLDLSLLNRHRNQIEKRQASIAKDWYKLLPLQTGYKIADVPSLHGIHEALSRILGLVDPSAVTAFATLSVRPEVRTEDNYVVVGINSNLQDVPESIPNLGALLDWTKENGLWFRKFRATHMFVLEGMNLIGQAIASKVQALEKALAEASTSDWKSVERVKDALGLTKSS